MKTFIDIFLKKLTAYVQLRHPFQLGICLKRSETSIPTAPQTLVVKIHVIDKRNMESLMQYLFT